VSQLISVYNSERIDSYVQTKGVQFFDSRCIFFGLWMKIKLL